MTTELRHPRQAALHRTWFPTPDWSGPRPPGSWARHPYRYPGVRPVGSYLLREGQVLGIDPTPYGWRERDNRVSVDLTGRHLVLGYGANLDPIKLSQLGDDEDVYVLRCVIFDYAAVWCHARRRAGDVVATIAPVPGRVEAGHGVLVVTDAQIEALDRSEGHPRIYQRQPFLGTVLMEDQRPLTPIQVYVGNPVARPPHLKDGRPSLLCEHSYEEIDGLVPR
jgi:hypothetical protein